MCCFCFAEHTSKCAFVWPTTGSRLLFQTSSSAPEQKDHILAILFQLFILSPVISSSKSLAHNYKGKSQSNLTKVHTATWNNSSEMLWCTHKGIFAFQVLICTRRHRKVPVPQWLFAAGSLQHTPALEDTLFPQYFHSCCLQPLPNQPLWHTSKPFHLKFWQISGERLGAYSFNRHQGRPIPGLKISE